MNSDTVTASDSAAGSRAARASLLRGGAAFPADPSNHVATLVFVLAFAGAVAGCYFALIRRYRGVSVS